MTIVIRPAESADLSRLAGIWHEHMTLLAQDFRFALAENGRERWRAGWDDRLNQSDFALFCALVDDQLAGYVAGQIQPAPLGLQFEYIGVVLEMVIDAHGYYGGVGRELVEVLRRWFREHDVAQVIAAVPRNAVVGQAFWRGFGAAEWIQWLWIK